MVDRFLSEVKRMHQLRQDINEMTPEEADELVRGLGDDAAEDWVFAARDAPEDIIEQVTVGVDPSGGGDEVGIVASALLNDGRFAVLADRTTTGSPAQWGEAAVKC